MYLHWPDDERCPYCGNKGREGEIAAWKASADKWLARCLKLEAKLAQQEQRQLAMEEQARAMIDRLEVKLRRVRKYIEKDRHHILAAELLAILEAKESP